MAGDVHGRGVYGRGAYIGVEGDMCGGRGGGGALGACRIDGH